MSGSTAGQSLTLCPDARREAALAIVSAFADRNGWTNVVPSLRTVRVFVAAGQAPLKEFLSDIGEPYDPDFHALLAVALRETIVIADEPTFFDIRPEYLSIDQGWNRVLAHEFIHLLHEAIVDGDQDQLGPRWFFEGFACLGAGQNLGWVFDCNTACGVVETLRAAEGRDQYAVFEAALRFFAERHSLSKLVERAGKPDFETWLCRGNE